MTCSRIVPTNELLNFKFICSNPSVYFYVMFAKYLEAFIVCFHLFISILFIFRIFKMYITQRFDINSNKKEIKHFHTAFLLYKTSHSTAEIFNFKCPFKCYKHIVCDMYVYLLVFKSSYFYLKITYTCFSAFHKH